MNIRILLLKSSTLLSISAILLVAGCKDRPVWSTELRSPDGKMIATAQLYSAGGFGASGPPVTVVSLNWTTGSQKPQQVLGIHDETEMLGSTRISMQWLAPTHLEISYNAKAQVIDYQAVRWAGVDITLSGNSGVSTSASH